MFVLLVLSAIGVATSPALARCGTSSFGTEPLVGNLNLGLCSTFFPSAGPACCNFSLAGSQAQNASFSAPVCGALSPACATVTKELSCLPVCSPTKSSWTDMNGKVTLCKSFADRYYIACQADNYNNVGAGTPNPNCVVVGQEWTSGTDMWESIGGGAAFFVAADNRDCLSAPLATSTGTSSTGTASGAAAPTFNQGFFFVVFVAVIFMSHA